MMELYYFVVCWPFKEHQGEKRQLTRYGHISQGGTGFLSFYRVLGCILACRLSIVTII